MPIAVALAASLVQAKPLQGQQRCPTVLPVAVGLLLCWAGAKAQVHLVHVVPFPSTLSSSLC